MNKSEAVGLLFILCLLQQSGCSSKNRGENRLEHIVPAHKPADFVECVNQLEQRGEKFFAGEMTDTKLSELIDVVDWLPELAADSDLKRPQWEAVQRMVPQLHGLIQNPAPVNSQASWSTYVASLRELAPLVDTWGQSVKNSLHSSEPPMPAASTRTSPVAVGDACDE